MGVWEREREGRAVLCLMENRWYLYILSMTGVQAGWNLFQKGPAFCVLFYALFDSVYVCVCACICAHGNNMTMLVYYAYLNTQVVIAFSVMLLWLFSPPTLQNCQVIFQVLFIFIAFFSVLSKGYCFCFIWFKLVPSVPSHCLDGLAEGPLSHKQETQGLNFAFLGGVTLVLW